MEKHRWSTVTHVDHMYLHVYIHSFVDHYLYTVLMFLLQDYIYEEHFMGTFLVIWYIFLCIINFINYKHKYKIYLDREEVNIFSQQ